MADSSLLRRISKRPLPKKVLQKFTWRGERYSYFDRSNKDSPRFFYYPSKDGNFYLSVEASLSKILFGHNVFVLNQSQISLALEKLSEIASKVFGLDFDAFTASVGRVDYCTNFYVGPEKVFAYLDAASKANPLPLKRKILGKIETVEFFNTQRKIYLYDKQRQMKALLSKKKVTAEDCAEANGLIRLEARFNNSVAVQRLLVNKMQLPDRTAKTLLNTNIAEQVLTGALVQFELDKPIPTFNERIEKLRLYYPSGTKFQNLLGFIQLCDYYGQDNLIRLGIMKKSLFYKNISELRAADALIYTNYHSTLPELSLIR